MDYQIVVLEVLKDAVELDQAERWWIAYGRVCDWPLTNLTKGGGPSETALAERRRRDFAATARKRVVYSPEKIAELERLRRLRNRSPAEVRSRCFELFEKHIGSQELLIDVVIGARVAPDTAKRLYKEWLLVSQQRGERTLRERERKEKGRATRKPG